MWPLIPDHQTNGSQSHQILNIHVYAYKGQIDLYVQCMQVNILSRKKKAFQTSGPTSKILISGRDLSVVLPIFYWPGSRDYQHDNLHLGIHVMCTIACRFQLAIYLVVKLARIIVQRSAGRLAGTISPTTDYITTVTIDVGYFYVTKCNGGKQNIQFQL